MRTDTRAVVVVWTVTALLAGLMAAGLSGPEPGASAAVWYAAFAILSAAVVAAARWLPGPNRPLIVVGLSLVTTAAAVIHLLFAVLPVYSGLTALILVLALVGTAAALIWARGSPTR